MYFKGIYFFRRCPLEESATSMVPFSMPKCRQTPFQYSAGTTSDFLFTGIGVGPAILATESPLVLRPTTIQFDAVGSQSGGQATERDPLHLSMQRR